MLTRYKPWVEDRSDKPFKSVAAHVQLALTFLLCVLMCLLISGAAGAQPQARIIVGPNVFVSWQGSGPLWEVLVAADPTNPRNLLGTGILTRKSHPQGGGETRGYYSRDGGYSWNVVIYPEVASASFSGDPQVAFGRSGTGYFLTLAVVEDKAAMLFYRSADGGITWDKPGVLSPADHPQILVDHTMGRYAGRIYISALYSVVTHGKVDYHVGLFRSADDGRTWIGPVEVLNTHDRPGRGINAMNPALFADGEIFVPFDEFPATAAARRVDGNDYYWFATSKDGGVTFSSRRKFALEGGGEIAAPTQVFPFFAIDNSDGPFRNRVYIAWMDRGFSLERGPQYFDGRSEPHPARLCLSYSSNRGKSWSKPKIVAQSPYGRGDQFGTSIAVNNEGTVAVSWYDTRDAPSGQAILVNRYFAASLDGGNTFLPAVRVSSAPTESEAVMRSLVAARTNGTSVSFLGGGHPSGGDYLGLAADADGTFHPLWVDGRTGTNQIWTAAVRVDRSDRKNASSSQKNGMLLEADVSDRIEAWLEPLREFPPGNTVELPIRLRNKSEQPIYGPIKVEVVSFEPDSNAAARILNSSNGNSGVGAVFDYSRALGDLESLPARAISEGVVWRFKVPTQASELPRFKFKVTARIEPPR